MKKKNLLILLIVFSFISCAKKKILDDSFKIIKPDIAYGGTIVSVTPFQIEGENGKRYIREKGGVGGINLANPELNKLCCSDNLVTESTSAVLLIDFPLKKQIGYKIYNENGFSKKDLVIELSKAYSEIYSQKEKYDVYPNELSDLELKMILVFKVGEEIYLETKVESKK